jgi:hypothetical protein
MFLKKLYPGDGLSPLGWLIHWMTNITENNAGYITMRPAIIRIFVCVSL